MISLYETIIIYLNNSLGQPIVALQGYSYSLIGQDNSNVTYGCSIQPGIDQLEYCLKTADEIADYAGDIAVIPFSYFDGNVTIVNISLLHYKQNNVIGISPNVLLFSGEGITTPMISISFNASTFSTSLENVDYYVTEANGLISDVLASIINNSTLNFNFTLPFGTFPSPTYSFSVYGVYGNFQPFTVTSQNFYIYVFPTNNALLALDRTTIVDKANFTFTFVFNGFFDISFPPLQLAFDPMLISTGRVKCMLDDGQLATVFLKYPGAYTCIELASSGCRQLSIAIESISGELISINSLSSGDTVIYLNFINSGELSFGATSSRIALAGSQVTVDAILELENAIPSCVNLSLVTGYEGSNMPTSQTQMISNATANCTLLIPTTASVLNLSLAYQMPNFSAFIVLDVPGVFSTKIRMNVTWFVNTSNQAYYTSFSLDTLTLINEGQMLSNCQDLFVTFNGQVLNTSIDGCFQSSTIVSFSLVEAPSDSYALLYGNELLSMYPLGFGPQGNVSLGNIIFTPIVSQPTEVVTITNMTIPFPVYSPVDLQFVTPPAVIINASSPITIVTSPFSMLPISLGINYTLNNGQFPATLDPSTGFFLSAVEYYYSGVVEDIVIWASYYGDTILISSNQTSVNTICPFGYAGPVCQYPICYGIISNETATVCSSHGACLAPDFCQCDFLYAGLDCAYTVHVWVGPSSGGYWSTSDNWLPPLGSSRNSTNLQFLNVTSSVVTFCDLPLTYTNLFITTGPYSVNIVLNQPLEIYQLSLDSNLTISSNFSNSPLNITFQQSISNGNIGGSLVLNVSIVIVPPPLVTSFLISSTVIVLQTIEFPNDDGVTVIGSSGNLIMNSGFIWNLVDYNLEVSNGGLLVIQSPLSMGNNASLIGLSGASINLQSDILNGANSVPTGSFHEPYITIGGTLFIPSAVNIGVQLSTGSGGIIVVETPLSFSGSLMNLVAGSEMLLSSDFYLLFGQMMVDGVLMQMPTCINCYLKTSVGTMLTFSSSATISLNSSSGIALSVNGDFSASCNINASSILLSGPTVLSSSSLGNPIFISVIDSISFDSSLSISGGTVEILCPNISNLASYIQIDNGAQLVANGYFIIGNPFSTIGGTGTLIIPSSGYLMLNQVTLFSVSVSVVIDGIMSQMLITSSGPMLQFSNIVTGTGLLQIQSGTSFAFIGNSLQWGPQIVVEGSLIFDGTGGGGIVANVNGVVSVNKFGSISSMSIGTNNISGWGTLNFNTGLFLNDNSSIDLSGGYIVQVSNNNPLGEAFSYTSNQPFLIPLNSSLILNSGISLIQGQSTIAGDGALIVNVGGVLTISGLNNITISVSTFIVNGGDLILSISSSSSNWINFTSSSLLQLNGSVLIGLGTEPAMELLLDVPQFLSTLPTLMNVIIATENCQFTGGQIGGSGVLIVQGSFLWNGNGQLNALTQFVVLGILTIQQTASSTSTEIIVSGRMNFESANDFLLNSTTLIIETGGLMSHIGAGTIQSVSNTPMITTASSLSEILNYGQYVVNTDNGNTGILYVMIVNAGDFNVSGNHSLALSGELFFQTAGGSLFLNDSGLISATPLSIEHGQFTGGGLIQTPLFSFSSLNGLFLLQPGFSLHVNGSFLCAFSSTLVFELSSNSQQQQSEISIAGNLTLSSLVYVKLQPGMTVLVGDNFGFTSFGGSLDMSESNAILVGAAFKTVQLQSDNVRNTLSLAVISSIGNSNLQGYQCQYLGDGMSFETVRVSSTKILVSLTTPAYGNGMSGWYSFGLGSSKNISYDSTSSYFILFSNGNSYQVLENLQLSNALANGMIDIAGYSATSIFGLGVKYVTMTMFLPLDQLQSQQYIYYVNNPEQTIYNVSMNVSYEGVSPFIYFYPVSEPNLTANIPCTDFLAPSRAETESQIALGLMMGVYGVLLLLSLCFTRYQPMKSRGISPFATLIFLIVQLGLEWQVWGPLPFVQQSLCLSQAYGLYPLQQVCFVMILLYFIRYFSIIRINTMKNNVQVKEIEGKTVTVLSWYVRVLRLLSQLWFILLLLVFFLMFSFVLNTIIMVGTDPTFICHFHTLLYLRVANAILMILVYLTTVLLIIGDMVSNYELILMKFDWITYVFRKDPYYFRVQIWMFVPYMLFDLASQLYFVIAIQTFPAIIQDTPETEALNTANFDILLLIDVVFPLTITMITFIYNLFVEEDFKENDLVLLLRDPKGHELMMNFCKTEYSVENLLCWDDIQLYKNLEKEDVLMKSLTNEKKKKGLLAIHAKRLCDKYISGDKSLMEVNVQKKDTDVIWRRLKQSEVDLYLFDKILETIEVNLCDSYSRLISTTAYKEYRLNRGIQQALMDKDHGNKKGWMRIIKGLFLNFNRNVKKRAKSMVFHPIRPRSDSSVNIVGGDVSMGKTIQPETKIEMKDISTENEKTTMPIQTAAASTEITGTIGLADEVLDDVSDAKTRPTTEAASNTILSTNINIDDEIIGS